MAVGYGSYDVKENVTKLRNECSLEKNILPAKLAKREAANDIANERENNV